MKSFFALVLVLSVATSACAASTEPVESNDPTEPSAADQKADQKADQAPPAVQVGIEPQYNKLACAACKAACKSHPGIECAPNACSCACGGACPFL